MSLLLHSISSTQGLSAPLPNRVIIFCHGSGDTGEGVREYVESVTPLTIQTSLHEAKVWFEYPTAVTRPYRLSLGHPTTVWFDRHGGMDPNYPEDTPSVEQGVEQINQVIDELVTQRGIPPNRIVLGGFSMGGGIAIQTAIRSRYEFSAVFALSSYLCNDSWVWEELERRQEQCSQKQAAQGGGGVGGIGGLITGRTPLWMAHGDEDMFVLPKWGEATAARLKGLGVDVRDFVKVKGADHELTSDELRMLFSFLLNQIEKEER